MLSNILIKFQPITQRIHQVTSMKPSIIYVCRKSTEQQRKINIYEQKHEKYNTKTRKYLSSFYFLLAIYNTSPLNSHPLPPHPHRDDRTHDQSPYSSDLHSWVCQTTPKMTNHSNLRYLCPLSPFLFASLKFLMHLGVILSIFFNFFYFSPLIIAEKRVK
jgi:hypothetical protein